MIPVLLAFWVGHNVGRAMALGRPVFPVYFILGPLAEGSLSAGG